MPLRAGFRRPRHGYRRAMPVRRLHYAIGSPWLAASLAIRRDYAGNACLANGTLLDNGFHFTRCFISVKHRRASTTAGLLSPAALSRATSRRLQAPQAIFRLPVSPIFDCFAVVISFHRHCLSAARYGELEASGSRRLRDAIIASSTCFSARGYRVGGC